ncbi:MAG TPA: SCP2 sterol-binding domain-containing protein, partial [Anaerolineales bacterium]
IVGGWRTLTFALEYLLNHTWLHFTESHLRFAQQLPELPTNLVNGTLNFSMETAAGALRPEDLTGINLVTILRLTGEGGGTWTFTICEGKCHVEAQAAAHADAEITTDIATYLKASLYNMEHPMLALLKGKTRIKGMSKSQQFQKVFAVTPSRIWNFVEGGRIAPT